MKLFKWKISISTLLRKFLRKLPAKKLLRKKGEVKMGTRIFNRRAYPRHTKRMSFNKLYNNFK